MCGCCHVPNSYLGSGCDKYGISVNSIVEVPNSRMTIEGGRWNEKGNG